MRNKNRWHNSGFLTRTATWLADIAVMLAGALLLFCAAMLFSLESWAATKVVNVGSTTGSPNVFVDQFSLTNTTTINAGDTVQWNWVAGFHSTTSGTCNVGGNPSICAKTPYWDSGEFDFSSGPHTFSHTFNTPGTYPYYCTVHDFAMIGTVIVKPAAASFVAANPAKIPSPAHPSLFSNPQFIAVGDFNGDTKLDMAVANVGNDSVTIVLGNGDGTFKEPVTPIILNAAGGYSFSGPNSIAVADFNGDGKLDLAVANGGGGPNGIQILLGNGDGTFQLPTNFFGAGSPAAIVTADFNGDGKPDLAFVDSSGTTLRVLVNPGDGTLNFTSAGPFTVGTAPQAMAVADFDGNGKIDLATANKTSGTVSVLLNNCSGNPCGSVSFAAAVTIPSSGSVGINPNAIATADFNNDGKPDLAVVNLGDGSLGSNNIRILLNTSSGAGNATFSLGTAFTDGATPVALAAADLNGDGAADLAVANNGNCSMSAPCNVSVFVGDGTGGFLSPSNFTAQMFPFFVAAGNLRGAGKQDLLIANRGDNSVSVLLNQSTYPPSTPGPATHFGVAVPAGNPFTVTAGNSFSVAVTAYDDYQRVVTNYTGLAHFISSDGAATLPADYTFVAGDKGIHTFSVTLRMAPGPQNIRVCSTIVCDLSQQPTTITGLSSDVIVTPGPVSQFLFSIGTATAGSPITFTVTAADTFGNTVSTYGGTVHFTSSDMSAVLPGDYTFTGGDAGVHTFTNGATFFKAASQTLTATDKANGAITGTTNVTVNPAAASQLVISAPPNVVRNQPFPITVTAKDPFGNQATSYQDPTQFTSSDGAVQNLPGPYVFTSGSGCGGPCDNGSHTFTNIKLETSGSQTITVRDPIKDSGCTTQFCSTASIAVAPYDTVLANLLIGAPSINTVGLAFPLTVTAQDKYSNTIGNYPGTVQLSSTASTKALPASYSFQPSDAGAHTFPGVQLLTAGNQTITVTDQAASKSGTANINVSPDTTTTTLLAVPQLGKFSFRQTVALTVTVTSTYGSTPSSGTVTFMDGARTLGTPQLGQNGQVTLTVPRAWGRRIFKAVYGGNSNYNGSTSSILYSFTP